MKRTRKQRGSALVFAVGVLFAASTVLLASASVSMASNARVAREIQDADEQATVEGIQNYLRAKQANDQLTIPSTTTVAFGTKSVNVTLGAGPNDRWFNVRGNTTAGGRAVAFNTNLSRMAKAHMSGFTLFSDRSITSTGAMTVNGELSSVFTNDTLSVGTGSRADGDTWSAAYLTPFDVRGNKREVGNTSVSFSSFSKSNYSGGTLTTPILMTALLVTNPLLGTDPYEQYYVKGGANLILPVLMDNRCTIFIDGDLTVNTTVQYLSQASRWVYIVNGNMEVTASTIQGTYIVNGTVRFRNAVNASKFAVSAIGSIQFDSTANISADRSLFVTRFEAVRHKIPGFWPTTDPGLMR